MTSGAQFASNWSFQLFDSRAPSSTEIPVLLLNQPINSMEPTGSSVNPLTPFPVVRTTIVALPNKAYPAATKFLPG